MCVVVGLIGSGQEIHIGEEAGIGQWRSAVVNSATPQSWTVHVPPHLSQEFDGVDRRIEPTLHLTAELRFHLAEDVHAFVEKNRFLTSLTACQTSRVALTNPAIT